MSDCAVCVFSDAEGMPRLLRSRVCDTCDGAGRNFVRCDEPAARVVRVIYRAYAPLGPDSLAEALVCESDRLSDFGWSVTHGGAR